ncbi:MAG: hypothetical protein WD074_00980 [Candidatus Saccharimonadales bacterium]
MTGNQAFTGIGFTPKAIIFWSAGEAPTANGTWGDHLYHTVGFTSGPTESYSVSGASQDAVGTSNSSRSIAAKCIHRSSVSSGTRDEADLSSFDADGFTVNWTTSSGATSPEIMFLAIGGDDVLARAVNWTSPTSTGSKPVTGVGFTSDLVLHTHSGSAGALPISSPLMYGNIGAMDSSGNEWVNSIYTQDAQTTSNTARYQRTDKCLAFSDSTGVNEEANYASMDADGFTLNFTSALSSAYQCISLCLSGISARSGSFTPNSSTYSVSGVGFRPEAMLFSMTYQQPSTPQPNAAWSLGASDGTNHRAVGVDDEDALSTTSAGSIWSNSVVAYNSETASYRFDRKNTVALDSFDSDGFTTSKVGGAQSETLFLALGTPNDPPSTTALAPIDRTAVNLTEGVDFEWSYSDPESGAQSAWALKRQKDNGDGTTDSEEWWRNEALDNWNNPTLNPPATMGASPASTATAYSNQRKIDRTQNGVLWAMYYNSSNGAIYDKYSTDNGQTWTTGVLPFLSGGTISYTGNFSFFIDIDDYCHIVYKNPFDGFIYYKRGIPDDASRTAYTWSSAFAVQNTDIYSDYPDIIAFRTPGSSPITWEVCIVASWTNGTLFAQYERLHIASDGSITGGNNDGLSQNQGMAMLSSATYSTSTHAYPSIDFNHTGDGKTVADNTPHLYSTWSTGATGSGRGIRFKKATHSGGSWLWGTEREISSTHYVAAHNYCNCIFDGTRVIIGGNLNDGGYYSVVFWERDAADTVTTGPIYVLDNGTSGNDTSSFAARGSVTYDADGNLYFIGLGAGSPWRVCLQKWDRATESVEDPVVIDELNINSYGSDVSLKRGYSNNRIEFIYTDGTSSPYDVTYGSIEQQTLPIGWIDSEVWNDGDDTSVSISNWSNDDDTYTWSVATKDDVGSASSYTTARTLNPFQWWDASTSSWVYIETENISSDTEVAVANLSAGSYKWSVATEDSAGAKSSYATEQTFEIIRFERWGVVQI